MVGGGGRQFGALKRIGREEVKIQKRTNTGKVRQPGRKVIIPLYKAARVKIHTKKGLKKIFISQRREALLGKMTSP